MMPSVQKHIKGPSAMVETYSRSTMEQTAEMVNVSPDVRPWQRRAGLESQAAGALLPSQLFFHVESPLLSQPVNILPIFPVSSQVYSRMKPSWTHLSSCWFCLHLSSLMKDHLFYSIICTHAHSFSQFLGGKICALSSVLDPDPDYF